MQHSLNRVADIARNNHEGKEANINSVTEIFRILILMERITRLSGYNWVDPQHVKVNEDGDVIITWKSNNIIFDIIADSGEAYMCVVDTTDQQYKFIGRVVFPAKEWNVKDCLAILQNMIWK